MKKTIRRIAVSLVIFLIFATLSMLLGATLEFFGLQNSNKFYHIVNLVMQMCMVLSGCFFFSTIINSWVFDGIVAPILGNTVPRLIKDLVAAVIFLLGITIIVGAVLDKPITGIWATSGVIGIVLGLALRNLILDAFMGLAVNIDSSYKIGDWVHIHARNRVEYIGCITEINWRTTKVRTKHNNMVVVPNSIIGQSVVTNFSAPGTLSRFELFFHLDFTIPTERGIRVLLAGVKEAVGYGDIEGDPEPKVRVNRVTETGVEYKVRYWVYPDRISPGRARHVVLKNVLHNLDVAGIRLAYPKQDIFHAAMPPRDLNARAMEDCLKLLSSIDLFRDIKSDALNILAANITVRSFKAAQKIVEMGAAGNSMFIILEGLLEVFVSSATAPHERKVGHIAAGQFFGEMALLTGKPRSATVVAITDVLCYEITSDDMMTLLNNYPDVLHTISGVIAQRQREQEHLLEDTGSKDIIEKHDNNAEEILANIKSFFGMFRDTVTSRHKIM